jgi:hypothetical protein
VSTSGSHWTATSSAKSKRTSPKRWSVIVILPSMFWAMARSSACLISCRLVVERRCDPQLVGTGVREAHGAVGACDAARLEHVQQAGGRLNLAVGAVQFLWVSCATIAANPLLSAWSNSASAPSTPGSLASRHVHTAYWRARGSSIG